jgi:hypothetical protein
MVQFVQSNLAVKLLQRLMARDAIVWANANKRHPPPEALRIVNEWRAEVRQKKR